jgi:hypothetical protein
MSETEKAILHQPPRLSRTPAGDVQTAALAEVIEWFLDYDERVANMRHPQVEALFQWKQVESLASGDEAAPFDHAEDRFAIGIFQALAENPTAAGLHAWLSEVVQALHEASETNREVVEAYKLNRQEPSAMKRAEGLPTERERKIYLTCCWLEALCTAEARLLGWVYQDLYGQPFSPENPPPAVK